MRDKQPYIPLQHLIQAFLGCEVFLWPCKHEHLLDTWAGSQYLLQHNLSNEARGASNKHACPVVKVGHTELLSVVTERTA